MNRKRRLLLKCSIAATAALMQPASPSAVPGKLRLRIAAGSAPPALAQFVRQTGVQVLFELDAIRGHQTRAVDGWFEPGEALQVMLEGSGLTFEFVNQRTISVHPLVL